MDPVTPAPPPEARLIQTARKAAGLTAEAAARSTDGAVSPVYWRDVERGYGYRRGERVPARASDRVLAHMAHAVRVTPGRLTKAGRDDAATVLTEILGAAPGPRASAPASEAEEMLAGLLARFADDEVIQAIGAQPHKPAYTLVGEILRRLEREGDPAPAREAYEHLLRRYAGDEVLQAISRQRAKAEKLPLLVEEMLDWRSTQEPESPPAQARNGTAG